jgi:hypothetical protein
MVSSLLAKSVRRVIGVCCAVLLLAACEASMEEVVAKHRPAVEAVFAKLHALDTAARDAPPVTEDKFELGGAHVVLEGKEGNPNNALFIRAADLAAPDHATSDGNGALNARSVEECGEALRGEFSGVPGGAELYLQECARAEYVFVLRTTTDEAATLIDDSSFQPGSFEGDVLLFRLADGALLGGFAVSAKSSEEITVATDEHGTAVDAVDRLNSDLSSRVFMDINTKLRALAPGSLPPL